MRALPAPFFLQMAAILVAFNTTLMTSPLFEQVYGRYS